MMAQELDNFVLTHRQGDCSVHHIAEAATRLQAQAVMIVDNGEPIYGSHQYAIPVLLITEKVEGKFLRLMVGESQTEISIGLVASTLMNFADDVWQYAFTDVIPNLHSSLFEFLIFNYDCFNMCSASKV